VNATVIGLVVVPVAIFLLGVIFAAIRGAIRFAQYMVRSEEAQESTASSNKEVRDLLSAFMGEMRGEFRARDEVLRDHGERIRVNEFAIDSLTRAAPLTRVVQEYKDPK
jgi:hypothetical protein